VDGLVLHQNGDRAAPKRIETKETERHSISDLASGLLSEVRLLNDDYTPMEFVATYWSGYSVRTARPPLGSCLRSIMRVSVRAVSIPTTSLTRR
jgi:hypothetical protein